jgi:peptidoglycan/LPS O-acetylase OafA/YrhL
MVARTHEDYLAIRTFPSLDGLRCLAVVAVVWHHTAPRTPMLPMTDRGFLGVDLFFVLSGFLIVTLLLRERDQHGRISLRDFYMRRTLRIFPLYYAIVLGLAALVLLRPHMTMAGTYLQDLPWLLTYTSNWAGVTGLLAIAWSLAAEEQFYLVWPAVERFFARWTLPIWIAAVIVSQALNFRVFDEWLPPGKRHADLEIMQATFTPILFGVALAHVLHRREGWTRVAPWLGRKSTPIVLLSALVLLANAPIDIAGGLRLGIHVVMVLLLGSLVVRSDTLGGLLTWRPVVRIGLVSYGVYLLHMFVRHGAAAVLDRVPVRVPGDLFVAVVLGTWLAAEVSFHLFESRFLALKKRFARVAASATSGHAASP